MKGKIERGHVRQYEAFEAQREGGDEVMRVPLRLHVPGNCETKVESRRSFERNGHLQQHDMTHFKSDGVEYDSGLVSF